MRKQNKSGPSFLEILVMTIFVGLVWYIGKLINPNESAEGLRLYTAIALLIVYIPLRFLFIIFFPKNEENE